MEKPIVVENVDLYICNEGDYQMKFCPRCGSTNIDWVLPQTWSKYECKDCGFVTAFVIEDGDMAKEIRKEYLKKVRSDEGQL